MFNKLIVFEGLDGSGKTTLINKLKNSLINKGNKVKVFQGLGSSSIGKEIRKLFLHQRKTSPKTKYFLSFANMIQVQDELIIPNLLNGHFVLIDRWYGSTLAYQSNDVDYDDEITSKIINQYLIKPQLTFYLDIDPQIGLQRKQNQSNHKLDLIEQKPLNYFENVRQNYLNQQGANIRYNGVI
ncbi:thymidylate kinase [Hydrangea phyllody phytoplasma]|uniref:Thymidylate kinase n=2 Tax=16SrI (Aster yellows group) TaxID=3042590 RepID=A0ABQ5PU08_9MOLU|nr:dTMP kinase [Hydrangea phyllody phytoplasma]GFZ75544.1 thymidylate kinase [Hydrangea phyllody phytoplasma]GLH61490.1 thymidylate kinase [Rhus yellows phytoplasma]GLH62093.1 thymidylate kinase [Hydrangea phyllody phytoplasma]